MLTRFFARRYLFSPKSRSVINVIAGVSVLSFAMPVAAMIVLLSVLNGFGDFAKSMSSAFDADLTVAPREGQTFASAEIDSLALTRVKGVGVVSYLLEQQVLLERDGLQTMATLRGVDDRYTEVFPIEETIPLGSWSVRTGDLDRLVLGRDMARTLGIRSLVRAEVAVYALRRGSFSSLLPVDGYSVRRLDVGGLFFLDLESENEYALTSLRAAQELFDRPGRISAISVRVADGADAEKVRREIAGIVGDDFTVRTRDEMNALFFRLVAYEKWGVFFISLLVLVLASFSVVGTLVMLMIEKRDDVATLRALGDSKSALYFLMISAVLNIGGDLFFVEALDWGSEGCALSTVLSEGMCCLLCALYIRWKVPVLQLGRRWFVFDGKLLCKTVSYGWVSAMQQATVQLGKIAVQAIVNTMGVSAMAAFTAASRIDDFAYTPQQNIGHAMTTFMAQNEGAGKKDRVKDGYRCGMRIEVVYALGLMAVCLIFAEPIIRLFVTDPEVVDLGVRFLRTISLFYLMPAATNGIQGFFRGIGDLRITLISSILNMAGRVAAASVLVLLWKMEIEALPYSYVFGWVLMLAYELPAMLRYLRKNKM